VNLDPTKEEIPCAELPFKYTATFTITTTGPVTVKYEADSSERQVIDPTSYAFTASGTKTFTEKFKVDAAGDHWLQVNVLIPNVISGTGKGKLARAVVAYRPSKSSAQVGPGYAWSGKRRWRLRLHLAQRADRARTSWISHRCGIRRRRDSRPMILEPLPLLLALGAHRRGDRWPAVARRACRASNPSGLGCLWS